MTPTPEEIKTLALRDEYLKARELAQQLPPDDPMRLEIEAAGAHLTSLERYGQFYADQQLNIPSAQDLPHYHLSINRFQPIRDHILNHPPYHLLDLGCCDGWSLINLAMQYPEDVEGLGVDINRDAVLIATVRAMDRQLKLGFMVGAIEHVRISTTFHQVLMLEVLEHVMDPDPCVRSVCHHLEPGGFFYASVPARPEPTVTELEKAVLHVRLFEPDALIQLVEDTAKAFDGSTMRPVHIQLIRNAEDEPQTHVVIFQKS